SSERPVVLIDFVSEERRRNSGLIVALIVVGVHVLAGEIHCDRIHSAIAGHRSCWREGSGGTIDPVCDYGIGNLVQHENKVAVRIDGEGVCGGVKGAREFTGWRALQGARGA